MFNFWQQIDPSKQKVIRQIGAVLAVILLGSLLWYFLTMGIVVVKTKTTDGTLSLLKGASAVRTETNVTSFWAWVPTGEYSAMVTNHTNDSYKKQKVIVQPFQITTVELEAPVAAKPEPVTNLVMQYPRFSKDAVYFYSYSQDKMAFIDSANNLHYLDSAAVKGVQTVQWLTNSSALVVGQADNEGLSRLYMFANQTLSPVPLPAPNSTKLLSVTSNEKGVIFLNNNSTLYKSTDTGKSFQQQCSLPEGSLIQSAHGNKLVNIYPGTDFAEGQPNFSYVLSVIDTSCKTYGELKKKGYESPDGKNTLVWSPDGTKFAFSDGFSAAVYDTNLKVLHTFPDGLVSDIVWENNHSLLYSGDSSVWRYDIDSKEAISLTSVYSIYKIYKLSQPINGTVYFLTGNDKTYSWYRFHVDKQITPNETAVVLGESDTRLLTTVCQINYIAFTGTTIVESYLADGYVEDESPETCHEAAKDYLSNRGISLDKVNFQAFQTPVDR